MFSLVFTDNRRPHGRIDQILKRYSKPNLKAWKPQRDCRIWKVLLAKYIMREATRGADPRGWEMRASRESEADANSPTYTITSMVLYTSVINSMYSRYACLGAHPQPPFRGVLTFWEGSRAIGLVCGPI